MQEATLDENPFLGIIFVPQIGQYAAYREGAQLVKYGQSLIGTFPTLEAAIEARRTALTAVDNRNRSYEKAVA